MATTLSSTSLTPPNVNYSYCDTDMEEIKFGQIWTINKFSQLKEANGQFVQGSAFSASENNKEKWSLLLYPRGIIKENEAYVSLFLRCVSAPREIVTAHEFSVLDNNREKRMIVKTPFFTKTKGYILGAKRFIERDYLMNETNGLLQNDKLTICCEVFIVSKPKNRTGHNDAIFFEDTGSSRLTNDLGRLVNSNDFSDVVLVAEDKELHAHKNILGARSPVFNAMFQHDMVENQQNRVVISDISFRVLEELVRFIYTGKLPVEDNDTLMKLLSAADKYALEDLKAMCDQKLSVKLTEENVVQLIPLASLQNCNHLKARLTEFMKSPTMNEALNELYNLLIDQHPQLVARAFQAKR